METGESPKAGFDFDRWLVSCFLSECLVSPCPLLITGSKETGILFYKAVLFFLGVCAFPFLTYEYAKLIYDEMEL